MHKYIVMIVLVFVALQSSAQGSFKVQILDSQELPDKPISVYVKPLIAAINSGDSAQISAFIKQSYSSDYLDSFEMEKLVADLQHVRDTYGELSFYSSRDYTGHPLRKDQLHIVLKGSKKRIWCRAEIFLDYPSPKIYELAFKATMPTEEVLGTGPFELSKALEILDSTLEQLEQMDMFAGVVLIADKNKILFQRAVGKADRKFNIGNATNTKFNIGYMVDMFNAIALMQLMQAEKLSIDNTLSDFLDETWLAKAISQKIQIRHLLTHSTGLGHHWLGEHGIAPETLRDVKSYKPIFKNTSLQFEPGTNNRPSNTAMHMAGALLEAVSGENYFRYIEENVYKKADIKHTGALDMQQSEATVATHYFKDFESDWQQSSEVINGSPSGGVFSTAADMHRFALALINYKLLNEDMTRQMFVPHMQGPMLNYGYGLMMQKSEELTIAGGIAGYPGVSSNLDIYPETGHISVILTNHFPASFDLNGLQYVLAMSREIVKQMHQQRQDQRDEP